MKSRLLTLSLAFFAAFFGAAQADFVENRGQWPGQVAFRAQIPDGALWAESTGFTYQFYDPSILDWLHPVNGVPEGDPIYRQHTYRMSFVGAAQAQISGSRAASFVHNYYLGSDSTQWARNARIFSECRYNNLYPGTDLLLYSKADRLKYDFIVHPGGVPDHIALMFEGADQISLDNGAIVIRTSISVIREERPYAYQIINGKIRDVLCSYVLDGTTVRFQIGKYDPAYDLVIDPEIVFSTYIGSSASNFGFTACNDSEENLISGAAVFAPGYPTTLGAYETDFNASTENYMDVAVSKFNPDGTQLIYSTYIGGDVQETPHSLVVDSNDNIILMGVTGSDNYPTTAGVYQTAFNGGPILVMSNFFVSGHPEGCDLFVTKFSASGNLLASTFVGNDSNDGLNSADYLFYNYGDAFRGEVNVDANDNVFVASVTHGNFPTTANAPQTTSGGGSCDGVLFKLSSNLNSLLMSTYVGGNAADACYAVEFSESGTILVAGGTRSADFPFAQGGNDSSFDGVVDGFVFRLDPVSFNLMSGTFIGTSSYDQVYFVQTDESDNIYTLGQTEGTLPITAGLYGQANSGQFIRKFDSSLSAVLWTTTIGTGSGSPDISPTAFLVSECGQIYFSGWGGNTNSNTCQVAYDCYATESTTVGLPVTDNAFQPDTDGSDFYLCVLSPDATTLIYGSFLGGTESAEHVDGGTSRFDKNGSVFQAVCAGCQGNSDFPTTPGAWSGTNDSFGCNIAVFRFNLGAVEAELAIDGPSEICEGVPAQFINNSFGATTFEWSFGDGFTSSEFEPDHIYEQNGDFTIQLIALDETECLEPDTAFITITILPGVNPTVSEAGPICEGQSVQLLASGSANLFWLDDPTLSDTSIPDPIATPTEPTFYYAVDFNDCESDTVSVFVDFLIPETDAGEDATICLGNGITLFADGGVEYLWTPDTGLNNPTSAAPEASPTETTTYTVTILTEDGCEAQEQVTITVIDNPPGLDDYPDIDMCLGNSATLLAEDALTWSWSPSATLDDPFVQDPVASPSDTTTYTVVMTNQCGEGSAQVTVNVIFPGVEVFGGGTICKGEYIQAWAAGASDYLWTPPAFAFPPDEDTTWLSPPETMSFTVAGTDENGCGAQDTIWVFVLPLPEVNAGPDQYFEFPGSVYLFGNAFGNDYSWSPPDFLSCTDCPYPIASPDQPMYYSLTVIDHNGCEATDSVLVKPYFPIWVPNTITPNNDGINDVFRAYGENIEGFTMVIFDRWGNKVFESEDIEEVWDGGIDGYYVQNDAYIWVIEYDSIERREQLTGHVNVVR